jgi:hypothetical protein
MVNGNAAFDAWVQKYKGCMFAARTVQEYPNIIIVFVMVHLYLVRTDWKHLGSENPRMI